MVRIAITLALIAAVGLASGCNTLRGAGKDIERGGQKIQKVAQ